MRPLAFGCGVLLLLASTALAQSADDPGTAVASTRDAEAAMAEQARDVTKSAVTAVFGGGGSPPAAAANAAAWAAQDAQAGVPPADAAPAPAEVGSPDAAALGDGRRDPFRPFTLDLQGADMPEEAILSPLQRYEIAQLRLTALVLDLSTPRAMVQDSSGMGYIVTPGTPIGRRHGVVKSIEPGRVVVEETVLDYYGRQQLHQVVMEMPRDDKKDDSSGEKP
jgi:type IV pilus assembly protein PilP